MHAVSALFFRQAPLSEEPGHQTLTGPLGAITLQNMVGQETLDAVVARKLHLRRRQDVPAR